MFALVGPRKKEVPVVEAVSGEDLFSCSDVFGGNEEHPVLLNHLNLAVAFVARQVGHLLQLPQLLELLRLVVFRLEAYYIVGLGRHCPSQHTVLAADGYHLVLGRVVLVVAVFGFNHGSPVLSEYLALTNRFGGEQALAYWQLRLLNFQLHHVVIGVLIEV